MNMKLEIHSIDYHLKLELVLNLYTRYPIVARRAWPAFRPSVVYKIPYCRARAWPSGRVRARSAKESYIQGRVRRASKGILHTST